MTLQKLKIDNFTVFRSAELHFGPGVNIIVGANGAGKSHILKLAYGSIAGSYQAKQEVKTKRNTFTAVLEEKILDVFRAERLENLIYGRQHPRQSKIDVCFIPKKEMDLSFSFEYPSEDKTTDSHLYVDKMPTTFPSESPVFIPTREILSIIPAFSRFHREKTLLLDGTYFDLSFLTQIKPADELHPEVTRLMERLGKLLNGRIIQEAGRFYLFDNDLKLEMPLVAEGLRKLAMLSCLLQNKAIQPGSLVFWDEPEANLNPYLMVELASILVELSLLDIQIVLATHSLFLLREIYICLSNVKASARFFAVDKKDGVVNVSQADSFDDIEPIASLDADLQQSDRYMALGD